MCYIIDSNKLRQESVNLMTNKQLTPEQIEKAETNNITKQIASKNINPNYPSRNIIPSQRIAEHIQNLWRHSVRCLWEVSMRCPCVSTDTNSPQPLCPICHGQGYFYPQSYELDMGLQSDENKYNIGGHGKQYLPGTLATPQFSTVSGIPSQNLKPGDRITVMNWTTPQEYIFNVTDRRLKDGLFLPYSVKGITSAYTTKEDGSLEVLNKDDFHLEDNFIHIDNKAYLDKNISVLLNVEKRFYVESLIHELRYENFDRADEKAWATGKGNKFVSYDQLINGLPQYNGTQTFQMPNQALLRRELLYQSASNLIDKETDNNMVLSDPETGKFEGWLNG